MFDMKKGFHPRTLVSLLTIGLWGLLICSIIDKLFWNTENAEPPKFFFYLQISFAAIWCLTLIIITPIQVLYFRRKNRDNNSLEKVKIRDFVGLITNHYLGFGSFDPDAKLPKWISISVLTFMWFLISIPFLFFAMMGLCLVIDFFTGQ